MINFKKDRTCTQADGSVARYEVIEEKLLYMEYKGKRQHIPYEFSLDSIDNMAEIFTSQIDQNDSLAQASLGESLKQEASKGDRETQAELFELAEGLVQEEKFEEAARTFRDVAIEYRGEASRERTRAEEAEAHAEWKSRVEEIYRRWLESNPNGACKLPRRESSVDEDGIRKVVVDQLLNEGEFQILFTYLETTLSDLGMEFHSPGGSIQRRVNQLLYKVFGFEEDAELSDYLEHVSVRVALDPIADEVLKRCSETPRRDERM